MLIHIHQLRDKIHALTRDLRIATGELEDITRNCKHKWVEPERDDLINNYRSEMVPRWIYTCEYCGGRSCSFKGPEDK